MQKLQNIPGPVGLKEGGIIDDGRKQGRERPQKKCGEELGDDRVLEGKKTDVCYIEPLRSEFQGIFLCAGSTSLEHICIFLLFLAQLWKYEEYHRRKISEINLGKKNQNSSLTFRYSTGLVTLNLSMVEIIMAGVVRKKRRRKRTMLMTKQRSHQLTPPIDRCSLYEKVLIAVIWQQTPTVMDTTDAQLKTIKSKLGSIYYSGWWQNKANFEALILSTITITC